MKKIFLCIVFLLSIGLFISCEKDDSLDPLPVKVPGQFIRLDITSKVLKAINPSPPAADPTNFTQTEVDESFFGGMLTSPSGKVVRYNLYIRRRDQFGIISEYELVKTITSFPTELRITNTDIANAFGLSTSDIKYGEEYYFYGESFDADGNRADFFNLSATVQGAPGVKQGYRFRTTNSDNRFFANPENLLQYDNYVFTP